MAEQDLATLRDGLAPHWDSLFGPENPAAAPIRERYLTEVTNKFGPGAWIVHIGCGTGFDTVYLAKQGIRVWAIDWSPAMVAITQQRISEAGVEKNAEVRCLAPREVGQLLGGEIRPERLDGAFAPWGALNQEEDLASLFDGLYSLLRPSGQVIAGLLNHRSLFGALGAAAQGNFSEGLRRLRGQGDRTSEWRVGTDLPPLPVAFPTPDTLKEIYGSRFKVEKTEPIGLLTPPAGLGRLGGRGGRLLPHLGRLERALAPLPQARAVADQTLVVIRRTVEGVWGPAGPHYLAN